MKIEIKNREWCREQVAKSEAVETSAEQSAQS